MTPLRIPLTNWHLADLMIRGLERTDDEQRIENGLVGWVEQACDEIASGHLSAYNRCELNIGPRVCFNEEHVRARCAALDNFIETTCRMRIGGVVTYYPKHIAWEDMI